MWDTGDEGHRAGRKARTTAYVVDQRARTGGPLRLLRGSVSPHRRERSSAGHTVVPDVPRALVTRDHGLRPDPWDPPHAVGGCRVPADGRAAPRFRTSS